MKKISQICLFSIFFICFLSSIVKANSNSINYDKIGNILISSNDIKGFGIKANPRMYVFRNSYGYFAILDVDGDFYPRQVLRVEDGQIKKITVSQYKKKRVRISIKLTQKLKLDVKYSESDKLIKISFLKKVILSVKKKKLGIKRKVKKSAFLKKVIILVKKKKYGLKRKGKKTQVTDHKHSLKKTLSISKKIVKIDKIKKTGVLPLKPILQISKKAEEKTEDKDPFSFQIVSDIDNGLPPVADTVATLEKKPNLFGIHGKAAVDINDLSKSVKLELQKSGTIKNTDISYVAKVRLKAKSNGKLETEVTNFYIDGFIGENTSYRFGLDNGALAGDSVTYFNGIEAFFPKNVENLFLSDIEAARIAVPELLLTYNLNESSTLELLWQLKHIEHDLTGINFLGDDLTYHEGGARYNYLEDSNILIGYTKHFDAQSIDLGLYYRNGFNLFPDYKLGIGANQKIFAEKIKNKYHTFMGSIVKVYDNLSLNTELVWNVDKTVLNSFGERKREDSLDIIAGIGYTFPSLDTKFQIGGSFEQENNASFALWLKPTQDLWVVPELTLACDMNGQKSAQLGLSKRIGDNFEVAADFSIIDKPQSNLAKKLGDRVKLEFKIYF